MQQAMPFGFLPNEYAFGFLPKEYAFEFSGGSIRPVEDYAGRHARLMRRTHPDGFIYPPLQRTVTEPHPWTDDLPREVPGSERPALLWYLDASHELVLSNTPDAVDPAANGYAAFVVHTLGYLFGYRLQFEAWQHDGRIPFKRVPPAHVSTRIAERFLDVASTSWQSWNADLQRRAVNVLYLHCRVPSYEWTWEQFGLEYMVTDACWKMLLDQKKVSAPKGGHAERINEMLRHFNGHQDTSAVAEIVKLRNDLQHEALWGSGRPNFNHTQKEHRTVSIHRSLNHRLIAGVLGWSGPYIRSNWTSQITDIFD